MKKYEIMAIMDSELSEKDAKTQVKTSLTDKISGLGGKITFEDFWGSRGFAYKIKGKSWGYYVVLQFDIDGGKLEEFKKDLNIDTKLVRFLITLVDEKAPAPKKYTDLQKENKSLEKESTKKEKPVVEIKTTKTTKTPEKKQEDVTKTKEKEENKDTVIKTKATKIPEKKQETVTKTDEKTEDAVDEKLSSIVDDADL